MHHSSDISALADFLHQHPRLFVLTGAGISTGSGIPGYRDRDGQWTRADPVQYRDYVASHRVRQLYWARSLVGWPWFRRAEPNRCHLALADWERRGRIDQLVTQNVDRLHQRAGSQGVIDLHGRLDEVICLDCGHREAREAVQGRLTRDNADVAAEVAEIRPDGDALLGDSDVERLVVPDCPQCRGMLKPDVVFFGENVPRARVDAASAALRTADAMLVIGSSLMVYSGFRFCRLADELDIPQAAVNLGRTRADELLQFKVDARFEDVVEALGPGHTTRDAAPRGV